MNSFSLLSFVLLISASLALPLETEQIREKRQMGLYGGFPSYGANPYGSMLYQRSVPTYSMMMPMTYGSPYSSLYSPMSMGTLGYGGATNPSFMAMGFRARNRH